MGLRSKLRACRPALAGGLAAGLVLVLCGCDAGGARGVPYPDLLAARGDRCVEPMQVIRREHMTLLLAQRDRTVHRGIRGEPHSLAGCVECHAASGPDGAVVPVDAPGGFCESCHRYVGVAVDCFECHAAVPRKPMRVAATR